MPVTSTIRTPLPLLPRSSSQPDASERATSPNPPTQPTEREQERGWIAEEASSVASISEGPAARALPWYHLRTNGEQTIPTGMNAPPILVPEPDQVEEIFMEYDEQDYDEDEF